MWLFGLWAIKGTLAREVSEAEIQLILCLPNHKHESNYTSNVHVASAQRKGELFIIHIKCKWGLI